MFLEHFRVTGLAMLQIFILASVGFFSLKRNLLSGDGLNALSRLLINIVFPALILSQMLRNFSFSAFSGWWIFPLASLAITLAGLAVGAVLLFFLNGHRHRLQFLSLVAFQNSGYLPLAIVAGMFSGELAGQIFIYIFLFLLGFDLVIWSFGIWLLTYEHKNSFRLLKVFSPPAIANLASLLLIALGLHKFIPQVVLKPVDMLGACTLPLAMFIVGGNIALIRVNKISGKTVFLVVLGKLIILPLLGLSVLLRLKLPQLIGLLVVMQLAMPSATSLSLIIRHHNQEDLLISQGIFFTHMVSVLTIPLFLGLYLTLSVIK